MKPASQRPDATLTIYRGLPFRQKFLYQTVEGGSIDLIGKKARLELRSAADALTVLYEFSTANGKIVAAPGSLTIQGMTDLETAAFDWQQAVGHLVLEEVTGKPLPIAYLLFNVLNCTTGVPA